MQEVPQIIDVAVTFKPIMSVTPIREKHSLNGPIVNSKILLQGSKFIGKNQANAIFDQEPNTSETGVDEVITPNIDFNRTDDLFRTPGQNNTDIQSA